MDSEFEPGNRGRQRIVLPPYQARKRETAYRVHSRMKKTEEDTDSLRRRFSRAPTRYAAEGLSPNPFSFVGDTVYMYDDSVSASDDEEPYYRSSRPYSALLPVEPNLGRRRTRILQNGWASDEEPESPTPVSRQALYHRHLDEAHRLRLDNLKRRHRRQLRSMRNDSDDLRRGEELQKRHLDEAHRLELEMEHQTQAGEWARGQQYYRQFGTDAKPRPSSEKAIAPFDIEMSPPWTWKTTQTARSARTHSLPSRGP